MLGDGGCEPIRSFFWPCSRAVAWVVAAPSSPSSIWMRDRRPQTRPWKARSSARAARAPKPRIARGPSAPMAHPPPAPMADGPVHLLIRARPGSAPPNRCPRVFADSQRARTVAGRASRTAAPTQGPHPSSAVPPRARQEAVARIRNPASKSSTRARWARNFLDARRLLPRAATLPPAGAYSRTRPRAAISTAAGRWMVTSSSGVMASEDHEIIPSVPKRREP